MINWFREFNLGEVADEFFEPDLEELVPAESLYKKLHALLDFEELAKPLEKLYSKVGRKGYPPSCALKCLFLQHLEDLSDRQLEAHLQMHIGAKFFCGFQLSDKTPDHTFFCHFRSKVGTRRMAKLFRKVGDALKRAGLIREIFTFVDASRIDAQVNSWAARDKALEAQQKQMEEEHRRAANAKKGAERESHMPQSSAPDEVVAKPAAPSKEKPVLSNKNLAKFSSDRDARIGCKGKKNYWLGYKKHVSVDMTLGLINKVAITPANVPDGKALKHVCPSGGMVFADKGYCSKDSRLALRAKGCHSGVVLKRNMKEKNRDKDRWLSSVRMPFENVFAHHNKTARYRTTERVQMQAILESFAHNFRKLISCGISRISIKV